MLVTGNKMPLDLYQEIVATTPPDSCITAYLRSLSETLNRPLLVFIDEIDALVGDSLVSVLRQIRAGYDARPQHFPQSIILCGVRHVRDYRIVLSNQDIITGGSAFNIKAKSLRLGNFSPEEIRELYLQHTTATGQEFDEACFPMIWEATEGQPWLVNALGYEVTYEIKENRDPSIRIIVRDKPLRIANGIYREIIPHELTWARQQTLLQQSEWYMNPDNSINTEKLLLDFQQFFRENADSWIERFDYKESGPQLLLQAFLQRVVNGGGYIDREYGLAANPNGYGGPVQRSYSN